MRCGLFPPLRPQRPQRLQGSAWTFNVGTHDRAIWQRSEPVDDATGTQHATAPFCSAVLRLIEGRPNRNAVPERIWQNDVAGKIRVACAATAVAIKHTVNNADFG